MGKIKKTVCSVRFMRDSNSSQFLHIAISPEIEELFKAPCEVSTIYKGKNEKGLEFYKIPKKIEGFCKTYNNLQRGYLGVTLTAYGDKLILADREIINLSVLRTKGISNGVILQVDDLIFDEDIDEWIESLGFFLKFLYHKCIEKVDIKATLNIEF